MAVEREKTRVRRKGGVRKGETAREKGTVSELRLQNFI